MYCANLCPSYGVKFSDLFRAATGNGMMNHKSIGTRYTANTSSFPRTYRTPVLLMMLPVYDPFVSKLVDCTCIRTYRPLCSTPTSKLAESPCQRVTPLPRSP